MIREILAKSILTKSGISDYAVNCYVGCTHSCVYCYARFMKRFTGHQEPWGQFLDVKINAPEVLAREVKRKKPGTVFVSSVCDAYQPIEKRYRLTRECVKILIDAGFYVSILTKSKLVARDFDIIAGHDNCEVGFTLTTMDEKLRYQIEPAASPTRERIATLKSACDLGIKAWAFLGPFMPGLSDTDEAIDELLAAIEPLPLSSIIVDKLNPRPGVWDSISAFLKRHHPELLEKYRRLFFNAEEYRAYADDLRARIMKIADERGMGERVRVLF